MKVEIINAPMLCWDDYEEDAIEWHVLAKIIHSTYPFIVISNENTNLIYRRGEEPTHYMNAKPIPKVAEMTVAEISKALGKPIKVIE